MSNVVEISEAFIIQSDLNQILGGVNLTVKQGEFVYVIGETGSGKSSLLKTLYADLPLNEGEIEVAGFNLKNIDRSKVPDLRRNIGMVFQDFNLLYDRSVFENLEFVLRATDWTDKSKIDKRIFHVLESAELHNVAKKKPHQLSGGEQQRVVIARALLNDPKLILADEPTGNLDPKISDEILELLHVICEQGTAVMMATHDHRLINKYPGTVYQIQDGMIDQTKLFG